MRRAEILEGVRMLKLRDVLSRWQAKQISQLEAAELMGVSERTSRRWTRRFEEEGEADRNCVEDLFDSDGHDQAAISCKRRSKHKRQELRPTSIEAQQVQRGHGHEPHAELRCQEPGFSVR